MKLANPKHELMAIALSRGATVMDAALQAGFTGINETQARALTKEPKIVRRIQEIREELEQKLTDYGEDISELSPEEVRAMITEDWIIKEIVVSIKQSQVAGQFNATKALLEMLGKEMGMFGGNGGGIDDNAKKMSDDKTNLVINVLNNLPQIADMSQQMVDITPTSKFATKKMDLEVMKSGNEEEE